MSRTVLYVKLYFCAQIICMLRILLCILLLAGLLSTSCNFEEKKGAQELFNRFNNINDSLEKMVVQWHDSLDQAVLKKDYSRLSAVRINMGLFLASSRSFVGNTPVTPNNEKLIYLEDSLLSGQQTKVSDVYPVFEQFSGLTPKELLDKNKALLYGDIDAVKTQITGIKKAESVFAAKYSLRKK